MFSFVSCSSVSTAVTVTADTGAKLAEDVGRVSSNIDALANGITNSLDTSRDLAEQFERIDTFVQGVIAENERLRKILDDYRNSVAGSTDEKPSLDDNPVGTDTILGVNTGGGVDPLDKGD